MSMPQFVLIISCRSWSDSIASVHTTESAARKALARYVKANWDDLFQATFDPNEDGDSLIEEYFAASPDFEDFEILAT